LEADARFSGEELPFREAFAREKRGKPFAQRKGFVIRSRAITPAHARSRDAVQD
jgi:hypothetical protein